MDPFIQYGVAAGLQAMQDSGLVVTEDNGDRIGAAIGSGIAGLGLIDENYTALVNGGPRKISSFLVPSTIGNIVDAHLSIAACADPAFPSPPPVLPGCIISDMQRALSLMIMQRSCWQGAPKKEARRLAFALHGRCRPQRES